MTVRVLHFSPGTATDRHDSHRAALGFVHCLQTVDPKPFPEVICELVWALPSIDQTSKVHALLSGADAVVVATPVYGQGSPWFLRKFFEQTRGLELWGTLGTAFATSGGQHTGGEMALLDTLRSLQGCGACTFTFAQKLTVIGMQQRPRPDGEFDLIDTWFLRQLARTCLVQMVAQRDRSEGAIWAQRLGVQSAYYLDFPDAARLEVEVGDVCHWMNEPLIDPVSAYERWSQRLGFSARPPEARSLPFAGLFPEPGVQRPVANWDS
jgi:NAD(P)H-dependent FMN reductase